MVNWNWRTLRYITVSGKRYTISVNLLVTFSPKTDKFCLQYRNDAEKYQQSCYTRTKSWGLAETDLYLKSHRCCRQYYSLAISYHHCATKYVHVCVMFSSTDTHIITSVERTECMCTALPWYSTTAWLASNITCCMHTPLPPTGRHWY